MARRKGLFVTPVIAVIRSDFSPSMNPEVADVFSAPLALFVSKDKHRFTDFEMYGRTVRLHSFMHESFEIWGLTTRVLIYCAQVAFQVFSLPFEIDFSGPYLEHVRHELEQCKINMKTNL